MAITRGAKGQKGRRGERGIPGPPGAPGMAGVEGSQGREGPRGETGSQGPEGAAGPVGKIPDVGQMAEQLEYIDRSVENIYREMGNHITRMTQLQRELDALRDHVRRLAAATSKECFREGEGAPLQVAACCSNRRYHVLPGISTSMCVAILANS